MAIAENVEIKLVCFLWRIDLRCWLNKSTFDRQKLRFLTSRILVKILIGDQSQNE